MAATTLGQIPLLHCRPSSSPHLSSSSWTETPSSSKCRVFSLAFARGLCWWRTETVRLDLSSRAVAVVVEAVQDSLRSRSILVAANEENEKP
jgi:hypothetical protein